MGFLSSLFRAATPENPSFNINSREHWDAFDAGDPSASGVTVNSEKALTYSPWWRGINLIANTIGRLPAITYQRQGNGKIRAAGHSAFRLLLRKPNPFQTAFVLKRQLVGHALSVGNGYAYIERLGSGEPFALWPLDPNQVTPVRVGGKKAFEVESEHKMETVKNEDMLHIPGFGYDGLSGYSVVDKARDSLGLGIALRTYGAKYFKNSARPATVLKTQTKLDPKAVNELRESWERMHGGGDNAHRTAILHSGLEAQIISFNARDSQFIEERQFELREVANWLGLPPHKLGDTTRTAFASLEQENQSFLDDCIDPWLVCIEEECEDKLLTEDEKASDTHLVEFNRRELVRGDMAARTNYWRAATGGRPWATPNEARSDFGLNPDEGTDSDEIMTPLNMGKGGQDNEPDDKGGPQPGNPTNNDAKLKAACRTILAESVGRMVRRIGAQAEKAAKDSKTFTAWVDMLASEHSQTVGDALAGIDIACQELRGDDRQGSATEWLLPTMQTEYAVILDTATAKTLAAEVARTNARLATELPAKAVSLFLGDE